jgi:hypothetical protein
VGVKQRLRRADRLSEAKLGREHPMGRTYVIFVAAVLMLISTNLDVYAEVDGRQLAGNDLLRGCEAYVEKGAEPLFVGGLCIGVVSAVRNFQDLETYAHKSHNYSYDKFITAPHSSLGSLSAVPSGCHREHRRETALWRVSIKELNPNSLL